MEELYKKDLHDPDNHDGVITHLEPDILECEVKQALGSIATNKASVLRSFNGPESGCPESTDKKVNERKRLIIPWFTQKANKPPAWGLLCSQRPQEPSRWSEGTEHLLDRVLEARAGK